MKAGPRTSLRQLLEVRPWRLGIDVVAAEWRNAAPVVDTCVEEEFDLVRRQIRRRLHVHRGAEHQSRGRDRPRHLERPRLRRILHPYPWLSAVLLEAQFLYM